MKTLYITILVLAGSTLTFAQQNKQEEKQTATQETIENFAKMNEAQKAKPSNPNGTLVSEQGLKVKKQAPSKKVQVKGLPNTATFEEFKKTIPKN